MSCVSLECLNKSEKVLLTAAKILPHEDSEEDDVLIDRLSELEATYYGEDGLVSKVLAEYIRNNIDDATKLP